MSIEEYYSKGEYVAEAQLRMREKYGYDNVWSLFYVGEDAELLGCQKILYATDGSPNAEDFVIKSYDDIPQLQVPDDILGHPSFEEQLTCLRILHDEVGGEIFDCGLSHVINDPAGSLDGDGEVDGTPVLGTSRSARRTAGTIHLFSLPKFYKKGMVWTKHYTFCC